MEKYLDGAEATEEIGFLIGGLLRDGDVVCLNGGLGAGKTLLSRGMASALGVEPQQVNSPTFTIMNIYRGADLEIRHFDLYRLNRAEELDDIGFSEYVGGNGVTLIEWANLFTEELPAEFLEICLEPLNEGRQMILKAHGLRYEKLLEEVKRLADFSD